MRRQPTPAPSAAAVEPESPALAVVITSLLDSPQVQLLIGLGLLLAFLGVITVNIAVCAFFYFRRTSAEQAAPAPAPKAPKKKKAVKAKAPPPPPPETEDEDEDEDEAEDEDEDEDEKDTPAPRKQAVPLPPVAKSFPTGKSPMAAITPGAKANESASKAPDGKKLWQAAAAAAKAEVRAQSDKPTDKLLNLWTQTIDSAVDAHKERNAMIKQQGPKELLDDLKRGNTRFWTGAAERPEMDANARRALLHAQVPKVAVLGCADSRVPIEIVLDQGLGDVFVSRNAGNLYGDKVAGTIDYAVHHLGVKLVVVMGHQGCGAVKASRLPRSDISKEPKCLKKMLISMKDSLEYCSETLDKMQDPNARDREAVIANAQAQVTKMLSDPMLKKKVDAGNLLIIAAFYEITSGIVDFIDPLEG